MTGSGIENIALSLSNSIGDVITTMTGFDVDVDSDCSTPEKIGQDETIIGSMAIFGSINGIISLITDVESAKIIIAYMTGIMPTELTREDIHDGMAELVNMLVGRIKADIDSNNFKLSITSPFSILGKDIDIVFKDIENRICRRFVAGDVEMLLLLFKI
ncbi:MAG: chemotaxis protein CheX [Clostridiales bacterium]|nr:chemotaxis protein CheX [Clostridiales bacterium]